MEDGMNGHDVAHGWSEYKDAEGRVYYYNHTTRVSQWTKPPELMRPEEVAMANQPWQEYTQNGRKYWYNRLTKQSVWDRPKEFSDALSSKESNGSNVVTRVLSEKDLRDGPADRNGSDEPDYVAFEQAEAAFWELLRRSGVTSNTRWDEAMRRTIADQQYRAIKDPKERYASFERYIEHINEENARNAKDRQSKLRQGFKDMLKRHKHDVKTYMTWKSAKRILYGEPVLDLVEDDREAESLYNEFMGDIRRGAEEKLLVKRKEAQTALSRLLISLDLEPYVRWTDARQRIETNTRFRSDPVFQFLNKLEMLTIFEEHIISLENTAHENIRTEKRANYRRARTNRESFQALLDELAAAGSIQAWSNWMDIYPKLRDDHRYTDMLGQDGSTPLDMFWDMVENARDDFRRKTNLVLDVLEDRRFEVNSSTIYEEFADVMASDNRTSSIVPILLREIFLRVQSKASQREEELRQSNDRRQRRRIDAVRSVIKHLEPPINLADTWESVKLKIQSTSEYQALDSEEYRRAAFEKYLKRLREREEDHSVDPRARSRHTGATTNGRIYADENVMLDYDGRQGQPDNERSRTNIIARSESKRESKYLSDSASNEIDHGVKKRRKHSYEEHAIL